MLHDAMVVFCALPTQRSSQKLLGVLQGLQIGSDHPDVILILLKEVLEYLHPREDDLQRIRSIVPQVSMVPDAAHPGEAPTLSITQTSRQADAIERAEIVRRALVTSMKSRLGLIPPEQHPVKRSDQTVSDSGPGPRVTENSVDSLNQTDETAEQKWSKTQNFAPAAASVARDAK